MTEPTSTDLVYAGASLEERKSYAMALSKAGDLVPKGFRDRDGSANPGKILLAAEYGNMLGIHPMAALTGINVIDGRPTPSPALMSGLVRKAGHKLRVTTAGEGAALEATATLIRADDPEFPFTVTWTLAKAKRAGLDSKDVWKRYPEAMLKARAISEVCREGAEDVLMGAAYTAEELGANVNEAGEVIEDAEIVPDGDLGQETPIIGKRGRSEETEVLTRSRGESTPPDASRPDPSRPVTNPRAGRARAHDGSPAGATVQEVMGIPETDPDTFEPAPWETRLGYANDDGALRVLWNDANRAGVLGLALGSGEIIRDAIVAKKTRLEQEAADAPSPDDVPAEDDVPLDLPY